MDAIATFIIKRKKAVTVFFIVLACVCGALSLTVRINYDMVDYLPEKSRSTVALELMEDEFTGAIPNLRVMVPAASIQDAMEFKKQLEATDGVSEVVWLDGAADMTTPLGMMDTETLEAYYKDGMAQYSVCVEGGRELDTVDAIYGLIGEDGALSGEAANTAASQRLANTEVIKAMLILVPAIIIILLLSTTSWIEPVFFLAAIGVSVLINLGTNVFIGEIFYMTQAISPILQLAVSLDYAIFLLHKFAEYRPQSATPEEAMRRAMKKSLSAIAASAATTLFGFVALSFMNFKVGPDLSVNLVKGIVFSFISVIFFLPALTLCLYKGIDKTRHKRILPQMRGVGKFSTKVRIPCLLIVVLLIVPCFLAQTRTEFTYGSVDTGSESQTMMDAAKIDGVFGKSNAVVLLVPKGDTAKEKELCETLAETDHVMSVVSYVTMVGAAIPDEYLDDSITSRFIGENYSRIILYTDLAEEGEESFASVEEIMGAAREYYGDGAYACGQSVNIYDIKDTVTADNTKVNIIAIVCIGLVLLLTFKSIALPLLLLLTIESAIWINLAVPYFMGTPLCYMGFLVINTVQLGATVDYAILLTGHYMDYRRELKPRQAILETLDSTFFSILISAAILTLAGYCLYMTSSIEIISSLGLLLGRGTILSFLMVICFLPGCLIIFDKVIGATTLRAGFYKGDKETPMNSKEDK